MKINTGIANLYASQRAHSSVTVRQDPGSFSSMLTAATSERSKSDETFIKKSDLRNMTHQELRDWTNEQIRNGKMSLDESSPFMAMSMNIPVRGDLLAANSNERVNFMQRIQAGIEGARSRNDEVTRTTLEAAMKIAQKLSSQTTGPSEHSPIRLE